MQLIDVIYSDIQKRSIKMNITITIGKIIAEISQYINHCKSKFSILSICFPFCFVASNFFLYAFTGRIFRHELRRLFTCHQYRFFSSSSQRLRHRAKKLISYQNPNEGVHEHFYSHGKCHTRILIAPKHLLSIPQNETYRQSICSTYSLSQIPITKQNSPCQHSSFGLRPPITSVMLLESPSLFVNQKSALISFVEKMKNNQTTPLLSLSKTEQTIKPYGLTDTTANS
jgi:hypothetical protein